MKKFLIILAFLPFSLFAQQSVLSSFNGYGDIVNVIDVDPTDSLFTIDINNFYGSPRFQPYGPWIAQDVQVGMVMWVDCARFVITNVNSASFSTMSIDVKVPSVDWNLGVATPLPNSRCAVVYEDQYLLTALPAPADGNSGALSGINNTLFACMLNHYSQALLVTKNSVNEITDYVAGLDTIPSEAPGPNIGETWRNSVGQLFYSDGTQWLTDKEIKFSNIPLEGLPSYLYKLGIDTLGQDTLYISNNGTFRRFQSGLVYKEGYGINIFATDSIEVDTNQIATQYDISLLPTGIDTFQLNNDTLKLSLVNDFEPFKKVILPVVGINSGTGISTSSTSGIHTITNTAPDQIVSITGAGISNVTGTYPNFTVTSTEVDGSITNEIQDLSLSGQTLSLSSDPTSVTLPVIGITAGTGISTSSTSGNFTITNTGDLSNTNELQQIDTFRVNGSNLELSLQNDNQSVRTVPLSSIVTSGGGLTGNGVVNYLSQYNSTSTLDTTGIIWVGGRMGIGTAIPGARFHVVGSGTGSTDAFRVANSNNQNLLRVQDNGFVRFGNNGGNSPTFFPQSTLGSSEDLSGTNLTFYNYTTSQLAPFGKYFFTGEQSTQTTGDNYCFYIRERFTPPSGTATSTAFYVRSEINQTAGGTGITRGLSLVPSLTNAVQYQTVHWSTARGTNNWGLYGQGSAPSYIENNLLLGNLINNARLRVQGPAATASTFGLIVTSSDTTTANATLVVRDDKRVGIGTNAPTDQLHTTGSVRLQNYPNTLNSTGNPVNVLSTSSTGVVESHPISEVISSAGGVTGSGAAGQVTFWNGTSTVTGDTSLIWNSSSKRLGFNVVGTTQSPIHIGPKNTVNSNFGSIYIQNGQPSIIQSCERPSGGAIYSILKGNLKNTTTGLQTSMYSIDVFGNSQSGTTAPTLTSLTISVGPNGNVNNAAIRIGPTQNVTLFNETLLKGGSVGNILNVQDSTGSNVAVVDNTGLLYLYDGLITFGKTSTASGFTATFRNSGSSNSFLIRDDARSAFGTSTFNSRVNISGEGNTSATSSLRLMDLSNTVYFTAADDGQLTLGKNVTLSTASTYRVFQGNPTVTNTVSGGISQDVSFFNGGITYAGSEPFSGARAMQFAANNRNTATSNQIWGAYFVAQNETTTARASQIRGMDIILINQSTGGTIGEVTGLRVVLPTHAVGSTISNTTGISIDDLTPTTAGTQTNVYSISSLDGNARMYHAGNVGIGSGVQSPTRTLDINGETRIRDLTTTTATNLVGSDADGVLSNVTFASAVSQGGGVSGTGVAGQVAYWSGTQTQTGSSSLVYNDTQKSLTLSNSTQSSVPRGWIMQQTTADGAGNAFIMQKSRGGTITSGTDIGTWDSEGFDGAAYQKAARIAFTATGTIGSGIVPGTISFLTANSSGTLTTRTTVNHLGELNHFGNVGIGSLGSPAARLHVRGSGNTTGTWTAQFHNSDGNNNALMIRDDGNVGIGTSSPGARLQIDGSGNTSTTTALTVRNSDGVNLLRVRNDFNTSINYLRVGNSFSNSPYIFPFSTNPGVPDPAGRNLSFYNYTGSGDAANGAFVFAGDNFTQTSGAHIYFRFISNFTPTSGTATFDAFNIRPSINQTGGANGISRGLYVHPILTAAADWRSFEWSNSSGWGIYGAGTAKSYFAGNVAIGTTSQNASSAFEVASTTQGILFPRMTTTQRNAISSPAAGLTIYNTTDGVMQHYNGSTWTDERDNVNGLSGLGVTNYLAQYNSSNTLDTTGVIWTGGRLGIGTATPSSTFDVVGSVEYQNPSASFDGPPLGAELLTTGTGTNWTGTGFTTGYTHVVGSTVALVAATSPANSTYYQIVITTTGRTAGSFTFSFGGYTSAAISADGTTTIGPLTTSTSPLTITPTTDFNGTVSATIKSIGGSSAVFKILNSSGTTVYEQRAGNNDINMFLGRFAGIRNTTGTSNLFVGNQAGQNNTTASFNTFIGYAAGSSNTIGESNLFIGAGAGQNNRSGSNNFFMGRSAGISNTVGSSNLAIGTLAGVSLVRGTSNIYLGGNAGQNNVSGSNNVLIGSLAGRFYSETPTADTSINNSIFIGTDTRSNLLGQTNQIIIANSGRGLGSNTTRIGNTSTIQTHLDGRLTIGNTFYDSRVAARIVGVDASSTNYSLVVTDSDGGTSTTVDPNLVVRNDGNVGIGTYSPTAKLFVKSTGNSSSTTSAFSIENSQAVTPLNLMTVLDNGNVGLGGQTSPTYRLDILGGLRLGTSTVQFGFGESGGNSIFLGSLTNHPYRFVVNTIEVARFTTNSRFGLFTDSPARSLHVQGEARISDLTTDTPTRIVGADTDGDLGELAVGSGLNITSGTISVTNPISASEVFIESSTATTIDLDANTGVVKDVNGTNASFTYPTDLSRLSVYKNGIRLSRTGSLTTRDFSVNTTTNEITFSVALLSTDRIVIVKI